jgi:hypothetical protein
MTTQASEPSKSTGFHPSIMKGAIAMNADDLEPTTDSANQPEPETNEQARLLEQAKAWRNLSLRQANTEEAALLTELDEEELIYAYRFYLADQRRFAKRCQETMIATVKVPEAIDWLKNLGDDELIVEYQLFQRLSEQMETFIVDGVSMNLLFIVQRCNGEMRRFLGFKKSLQLRKVEICNGWKA